jgi:hypothetical protein
MKLSEIEAVSPEDFVIFENDTAYSYTIDRGCKGNAIEVDDFPKLYTADQMQQFMVQNVRHALTLYGAKVCGFHLEQLEKSEIEKIIQDLFTEDTKNDS